MAIVIKKKISLDFLGEDYASSYVVFKSLPIEEYSVIQEKVKKVPDGKFMDFVVDFLKERLIEGKIDQDKDQVDITIENFSELDADVMFVCYKSLTGQTDPKV